MNIVLTFAITLTTASLLLSQFSVGQSPGFTDEPQHGASKNTNSQSESLLVKKCNDFAITGDGSNPEWLIAPWHSLTKLDKSGIDYESKFKMLYSATGVYVLFSGQDSKITTLDYKDFEYIFNGDVFEVFFHPDPKVMVYFEYEVNQLNKELILSITNKNGQGVRWVPWQHDGKYESGIEKMVTVVGGKKEVGGTIQSWSAEIFFSYESLGHLPKAPPKNGTVWNANFCRLDYDSGSMIKYSWTPTIKVSFHELDKFRSIIFE